MLSLRVKDIWKSSDLSRALEGHIEIRFILYIGSRQSTFNLLRILNKYLVNYLYWMKRLEYFKDDNEVLEVGDNNVWI